MTSRFLGFLAVLASIQLLGCASVPANAPPYQPLPPPTTGFSNLYIYRIDAYPIRRTPDIALDSQQLFSPPEGSYAALALPAGLHTLQMRWPRETGIPTAELNLNLTSGQSTYVKVIGTVTQGNSYNVYAALGETRINTKLTVADPATADFELRACCKRIGQ